MDLTLADMTGIKSQQLYVSGPVVDGKTDQDSQPPGTAMDRYARFFVDIGHKQRGRYFGIRRPDLFAVQFGTTHYIRWRGRDRFIRGIGTSNATRRPE